MVLVLKSRVQVVISHFIHGLMTLFFTHITYSNMNTLSRWTGNLNYMAGFFSALLVTTRWSVHSGERVWSSSPPVLWHLRSVLPRFTIALLSDTTPFSYRARNVPRGLIVGIVRGVSIYLYLFLLFLVELICDKFQWRAIQDSNPCSRLRRPR